MTITWVFNWASIYTVFLPELKPDARVKLATMIEPCFKPSTHPYHPFLFESDISMVIFTFTFVGTGTDGTSNRTIYLLRPQSLVLLMYPNPWSPHIVPHEFFTIQCVAVYPTNKIE